MRTLILVALALMLIACAPPVQEGSQVTVEYTGMLENGTVFDTSRVVVAREKGIYDETRVYAPLVFTVGEPGIIAGLQQGLIGMREGEEREITVPPSEGYGSHKQGLISAIPIVQELPLVVEMQRELRVPALVFFGEHLDAQPGDIVQSGDLNYTYVRRDGEEIIARIEARVDERMRLPQVPWQGEVVAVENDVLRIRQLPPDGGIVETPAGPGRITIVGDSIIIRNEVEVGAVWENDRLGRGRVIGVNETHARIDFNHPLAGETLRFDVRLMEHKV